MAYARTAFERMRAVGKQGAVGDHLAAAKRQGAAVTDAPDIPSEMVYLWEHYRNLSRSRGGNGFGPNPIGWPDIEAYDRLTRSYLEVWEVKAIRAMDDLFLATMAEKD